MDEKASQSLRAYPFQPNWDCLRPPLTIDASTYALFRRKESETE